MRAHTRQAQVVRFRNRQAGGPHPGQARPHRALLADLMGLEIIEIAKAELRGSTTMAPASTAARYSSRPRASAHDDPIEARRPRRWGRRRARHPRQRSRRSRRWHRDISCIAAEFATSPRPPTYPGRSIRMPAHPRCPIARDPGIAVAAVPKQGELIGAHPEVAHHFLRLGEVGRPAADEGQGIRRYRSTRESIRARLRTAAISQGFAISANGSARSSSAVKSTSGAAGP